MQQREYHRLSSPHQQRSRQTSADQQRWFSSRRQDTTSQQEEPLVRHSSFEYEGRAIALPSEDEHQLLPHRRNSSHVSQQQEPYSSLTTSQSTLRRLSSADRSHLHVLPSVPEQHSVTHHPSALQQQWSQDASNPSGLSPQRQVRDSLSHLQRPSPSLPIKHLATAASLHLKHQQQSPAASPERGKQQGGPRQEVRTSLSLLTLDSEDGNRAQGLVSIPSMRDPSDVVVSPTAAHAQRRRFTEDFARTQEDQQGGENLLQQPWRQSSQQRRLPPRRDLEERDVHHPGRRASAVFPDSEEVSNLARDILRAGSKLHSHQQLPYTHRSTIAGLPQRGQQQQNRIFTDPASVYHYSRRHTLPTVDLASAAAAALAYPTAITPSQVAPAFGGGNDTATAAPPAAAGPSLSRMPSTSTQRSLPLLARHLRGPRPSAPAVTFPLRPKENGNVIEDAERQATAVHRGGQTVGNDDDLVARRRRARTVAIGGAEELNDLFQSRPTRKPSKGMLAAMRDMLHMGRLSSRHERRPITAHTRLLSSNPIRCQSALPAVVIAFTLPAVAAAFAPLCPDELPHALLPICGVPLLLFTLNFLKRTGITEVLLLVKDDGEGRAIRATAAAYEEFYKAEAKRQQGLLRRRQSHQRVQQRRHTLLLPLEDESGINHQQQQQEPQRYGSYSFAAALPRIDVVELPRSTSSVGDALRALDSRADIRTDFLLMMMGSVISADLQLAMAQHLERARFSSAGADNAAAAASDGDIYFGRHRRASVATVAAALYAAGATANSAVLEARAAVQAAAGYKGIREQLITQILARVSPSSPLRVNGDDTTILIDVSTQAIVAVKNLSSSNSSDGADLDAHELFGVSSNHNSKRNFTY